MDILCIATELSNPVRSRPRFWKSLIAEIRTVYNGKLTYAANWHGDYDVVELWPHRDYIGVNAYFPQTDRNHVRVGTPYRKYRPAGRYARKTRAFHGSRLQELTRVDHPAVGMAAEKAEPARGNQPGSPPGRSGRAGQRLRSPVSVRWEDALVPGTVHLEMVPGREPRNRGQDRIQSPEQGSGAGAASMVRRTVMKA